MSLLLNKRFYFVRHGVTDWNKRQLCQGQIDVELNSEGREEAKVLGHFLQEFMFSKIWASPLKRALETAQIIQQVIPQCPMHIVDDLKERGWGELESAQSSEMYAIEIAEEQDALFKVGKGVEPRNDFKSRIIRGMNRILSDDEIPLIVSHGRVFLTLCEILQIDLIRQIPNLMLIECLPSPKGWEAKFIPLHKD